MNFQTKIGFRIKEIRTMKGMTQEDVAFKADIDRTFMNHVERGKRNISINTLEKITNALTVSLKDFFDAELFIVTV